MIEDGWDGEVFPLGMGIGDAEAGYIRDLRVKNHFTWRMVASACWDRFGGRATPFHPDESGRGGGWSAMPSNQLVGMELCARAARFLGEDYSKEPWN